MPKNKKTRQAQIKDDFFKSKFPLVFNVEPVTNYLNSSILPGQPFKMILKDNLQEELKTTKNHPIAEVVEDLTLNRGLKKDIEGWGIIYYPPLERNSDGKYEPKEIKIETAPYGVGIRVFMNLGDTREVLNFDIPSFGVKKQITLHKEEGFSLDLGIAQVMDASVFNGTFERVQVGNGHRPLNIKKNPSKRCLVVMDGYISIESLTDNVQRFIKSKTGYEFNINSVKDKIEEIYNGTTETEKNSDSKNETV